MKSASSNPNPPLPNQTFVATEVLLLPAPQATSTPEKSPLPFPPLVLVVVWMSLGILLDRWLVLPILASLSVAVITMAAWLGSWWRSDSTKRQALRTVLLAVAIAALASAWHHDRYRLYATNDLALAQGEFSTPVCVQAIVMQSPRIRAAPPRSSLQIIPQGDVTELVVWIKQVRTPQGWQSASGWADVSVQGHLLGVEAGDTLQIFAESAGPRAPLNPGELDFRSFQRSRRTLTRLRVDFPESVTRLSQGAWYSPRRLLGQMRAAGIASLQRHIAPQRSHLASAILLGAREQLDTEQNNGFLVTGTIHVLSISGLHVGILAWGFWVLLRTGLLPRTGALWGAMILSMLYAVLTGGEAPVMRATIMVQVVCIAMLLSRRPDALTSLAAAALCVLIQNPMALFSTGTQLSFLAVAVMFSMGTFYEVPPVIDPLDRLITATRPWYEKRFAEFRQSVWRVTMTGVLVWITALPLVWYQYHLVSPVAVPLGPVVWLPITVTLFAGFGVLLFAPFAPPLADFCGWLTDFSLWLIELSIDYGRWPTGSYAWLPSPPLFWVVLFYLGVGVVLVFPALQKRRSALSAIVFGWTCLAWLMATNQQHPIGPHHVSWVMHKHGPNRSSAPKTPSGTLTCTFVAVGHGTSVLLEFPSGKTMLYDAGRMGSPQSAIRPIAAVLWERGITHLDALLISHADSDHFCAIPELLQRFSIGTIYVTPSMDTNREPATRELMTAIKQAKIPILLLDSQTPFLFDSDVTTEVLHPPPQGVRGSDNANSLVILFSLANYSLLLPGDLESPGLEDLLQQKARTCDAIMAPHHGSRRSDPVGLALWAKPQLVVISGKRDAEDLLNIQRVKDSYEARGATALHTAELGAISLELNSSGISVSSFLPPKPASP